MNILQWNCHPVWWTFYNKMSTPFEKIMKCHPRGWIFYNEIFTPGLIFPNEIFTRGLNFYNEVFTPTHFREIVMLNRNIVKWSNILYYEMIAVYYKTILRKSYASGWEFHAMKYSPQAWHKLFLEKLILSNKNGMNNYRKVDSICSLIFA